VFSNVADPDAKKIYPTLQALRSKYGDKLRIVWKDNWVSKDEPSARPAAIALRSVFLEKGAEAFFKVVSHAYVDGQVEAAALEAWAVKELGVDAKAFEKRRTDATGEVEAGTSLAGKLGAGAVPGVFVNGVRLAYTVEAPELITTIDAELLAVEAETKQGVAASAVYQARVAKNYKAPESKPIAAPKEDTPFAAKVSAGTSPSRGPSDAPITLIEFSELQCPHCRKLAPTLKRLQESYSRDLRLVFKHRLFPSHDRCIPAGNIAYEAKKKGGDVAFWQAIDLLSAPEADKLDDAALSSVATKLGLGASALECAKTNCNKTELDTVNLEADAAGIRGIPAMFVNGRAISGNQPYEALESLVLWERAKLQKHVDGGGTRTDYQTANATRLRSLAGMTVKDTQRGVGPYAVPGKTLSIHYRGTLPDGKEFDSSLARNVPLKTQFKPGQFVIGFEEGIIGMREGGKRTITLPPEAHYGVNGKPPQIPANTVLTFELELVKVE
jgi:FKBP-type peptidyl-prolyl cis-trans isomerase